MSITNNTLYTVLLRTPSPPAQTIHAHTQNSHYEASHQLKADVMLLTAQEPSLRSALKRLPPLSFSTHSDFETLSPPGSQAQFTQTLTPAGCSRAKHLQLFIVVSYRTTERVTLPASGDRLPLSKHWKWDAGGSGVAPGRKERKTPNRFRRAAVREAANGAGTTKGKWAQEAAGARPHSVYPERLSD